MGKVKKILLMVLTVAVLSVPFSTVSFASGTESGNYPDIVWDNFNYVWNDSYGNGVVCPKCGAIISKLMQGTCAHCGFNALIDDGSETNYRPGYQTGGGSAGTGGVGRADIPGYADSNTGTPTYNSSGELQLTVYPQLGASSSTLQEYPANFSASGGTKSMYAQVSGLKVTALATAQATTSTTFSSTTVSYSYRFVAPVDGLYYIKTAQDYATNVFLSDGKFYRYTFKAGSFSASLTAGGSYTAGSSVVRFGVNLLGKDNSTVVSYFHPVVLTLVPKTTSVTNYNQYTINKNQWNGNIYVDNSKNLTYIYPQYTTVNENNEYVTNISENPIIYNNTTNQYYTYVNNNYYYIADKETPSVKPSYTPGGGATRGGGVGRTPTEDAADWTLSYYVLNNRRYDAYYALKQTAVDTDKKLPWIDNKHYLSTTEIPIANGQYQVTVPDDVYWRAWRWDETSQTLTGLNNGDWHASTMQFTFTYSEDLIFEFRKKDGSEFNSAKDVILKLKNTTITDYVDGGEDYTEPDPSPSPSPSPSPDPGTDPTPTPTPGGNTGTGDNTSSGGDTWNPFKWLTDLLKDLIEDILKGLWKLLTSIFGFILWLLSLLFKLFPWMPNSGILALCAGVVVVTIVRIIKFITGR